MRFISIPQARSALRYLSVCSGIEAASVAWGPLGMEPCGFSEVSAFPSKVLKQHYPEVPNLGDMEKFREWNLEPFDILVGGTPCQAFSIAGLRKGLEDPRGNLALVYLGILDRFRPRWAIWENVPGVLSCNRGRDFGTFLGSLAQLGYGFAYRVLDAQFFGVPQRRRRVFVVAHLGDWRRAAAVLFERESVPGDFTPRREAQAEIAGTLAASTGGADENDAEQGRLIVDRQAFGGNNTSGPIAVATARNAHGGPHGRLDFMSETFIVEETQQEVYSVGLASWTTVEKDLQAPLTARHGDPGVVAFTCKDYGADVGPVSPTLRAMGHTGSHANGGGQVACVLQTGVRRLTPLESERLQGFPDNYTNTPWGRGEGCPDGPRYKAVGNSMAVPVMRWIGRRIQLVEGGDE